MGVQTASPSGQFLVVAGPDTDPKRIDAVQEDLAIMSHLLERAAGNKTQDMFFGTAMNVPLHTLGPQRMVRGLYLDGYGAVFMLNVRLPLTAGPPDVEKSKGNAKSNWERSKRELFGPPDHDVLIQADDPFGGAPEGYDKRKVDELQRQLLECLKEAVNIRELKPEEMIVVAVMGAKSQPFEPRIIHESASGSSARTARPRPWMPVAQASDDAVMTLRVRKAEAEAFSKGDLTFDQFRQRAVVTVH